MSKRAETSEFQDERRIRERTRRRWRSSNATEDLIAVVDELGVAVVDEEAHRPLELTQLPTLVSGRWVTQAELGWAVQLK